MPRAIGAFIVAWGLIGSGWPTLAVAQDGQGASVPKELTASAWSSIRAAYEAGRHAVLPVDGGCRARNPGQRWVTRFDGRGFTVEPDGGDWTWGLETQSYGFVGQLRVLTGPEGVVAEGQRVAYDWDGSLTEWYVNDTRGLEHGYTIHRRPAGLQAGDEAGPLTFALAVRGGMEVIVEDDGRGAHFIDGDGATVLSYRGLLVLDAEGHDLPARLEPTSDGLRLIVDERDATYPVTIDPIAQQAYLKASNTGGNDSFGRSVAVSGDTVVVGANLEDSNATGVNSNQSDNSASASGAAYVFTRSGTAWSQQAYLKASNTDAGDVFGSSVAVSGDTVVVGATGEDSNATGVNGNQSDNSASGSGAAYVFTRSGTTWSQQAYLKASNTDATDVFGYSVAISGDTVVVGAYGEDSGATGVNGDEGTGASGSGAAYVFARSGTTWSQQAYLKASNTGVNDNFGRSASVSGDTVVVGAYDEDSNATGVNGNQSDNSASASGAAYVFSRSGTDWSQQAYLKASNTSSSDRFGWSASVSGDTVVVGAYDEDSNATGVNGNQNDNSASDSGAAYVFTRSGTVWSQQAYLKASNTEASDDFGFAVAVSGDTVVVGADGEDSSTTGVDGDGSNNGASASGAAYVFTRTGTDWSQLAYLKASNTGAVDLFGSAVAVSGNIVVAGAYNEDSSATGVNGNQSDNSAGASGAAYVFDLDRRWEDLGFALGGTYGDPVLVGSGTLVGGEPMSITLSNALETAPAFLFLGLAPLNFSPFYGGTLVPDFTIPPGQIIIVFTDGSGEITLGTTWPMGLPSGFEMYLHYWIADAGGPFGFSASNALKGTTP